MPIFPQDQVFWYLQREKTNPLRRDRKFDIVVVGGGMAGLSAAQSFAQKGLKVALLEQYYCGSGASGKSSGFITPDAELSLSDFTNKFGKTRAKNIWELITSGVHTIKNNIHTNSLDCDYLIEDTLIVANSRFTIKQIKQEHKTRLEMGYESNYYNQQQLPTIIGSEKYFAGVSYSGNFAINSYAYCQGIKKVLQEIGVEIFEETPVLELTDTGVRTQYAQIKADYTIVCTDRFVPDLCKLQNEVYHAQNFLLISQVLTDEQIKLIFPQKKLMAWDTDIIYTYFRLTGDNRLIVGGGSVLNTYAKNEIHHSKYIYNKLTHYFNKKFPNVCIQFEQFWPGLIGLSKDIMPIAGFDKDQKNIYYITACAGLPIAAALGNYSAERIVNKYTEFDDIFDPYRKYPIGSIAQSIIGTKAAFALSNLKAKFF